MIKTLTLSDEVNSLPVTCYADTIHAFMAEKGYNATHVKSPHKIVSDIGQYGLVHVQQHPDAQIDVEQVALAKRLGVPVVVTCHEFVRVPPEKMESVHAFLKIANYAIFSNLADQQAALKRHRHLREKTSIVPMISSVPTSREAYEKKMVGVEGLLYPSKVLHFGVIKPHKGVAAVVDAAELAGGTVKFTIAGQITAEDEVSPEAMALKKRAEDAGVEWNVTRSGFSGAELAQIMRSHAFAYLPFGDGGASPHSSSIPAAAEAGALILSHAGSDTTPELGNACHLIDRDPAEVMRTIRYYQQNPDAYRQQVTSAREFAEARSPEQTARLNMDVYEKALQKLAASPRR